MAVDMDIMRSLMSMLRINKKNNQIKKIRDKDIKAKIEVVDNPSICLKINLLSLIIKLIKKKNKKFIEWSIKAQEKIQMRTSPQEKKDLALSQNL